MVFIRLALAIISWFATVRLSKGPEQLEAFLKKEHFVLLSSPRNKLSRAMGNLLIRTLFCLSELFHFKVSSPTMSFHQLNLKKSLHRRI